MSELAAGDFRRFFRDVHGRDPFPWQQRLTEQVLAEGWPATIDLPTGTGKTAALDTAVFTLATHHETAPRRIVFVIDRRIVVDQVCVRATRIRDAIQAGGTDVLRRLRERLQELGGDQPLGVVALRGGIPIDRTWAHRPDQPWVLVSTVDQFGSRLLFRGYGVTPGMHPIHAGLAGNDCLILLDEVHLSIPFAETLEQVARTPRGPLPRRFEIVQMSATPGRARRDTFRLDRVADIEECEELRRRVRAGKKAELVEPVPNRKAVPKKVLKLVRSISGSGTHAAVGSVGVVVNRVGTAQQVHRVLIGAGFDAHLITGRMRPLDRVAVLAAIQHAVDPERDTPSQNSKTTIVVATQAIEVGADFSFDAIVTECAPVDSLRQRFGRLNRRGKQTEAPARAWILGIRSEVGAKKPDPIYGDAVKSTWTELQRRREDGLIDVGPESLTGFPDEAVAPRQQAPLLLQTHLDAWVQTSPQPIAQPAIDWFLHGIDREEIPEVSIVWRRDHRPQVLRLVPPRQAEALSVPIDAVKSWLSGASEIAIADVQRFSRPNDDDPRQVAGCLRWKGLGKDPEPIKSTGDLRPGDMLIVDPKRGGLRAHTWDPSSDAPVEDLGDAAQAAYGRRVTLRLDEELSAIASLSSSPPAPRDNLDPQRPAERARKHRIKAWLKAELTMLEGSATNDDEHPWFVGVAKKLIGGFDCHTIPSGPDEDGVEYYVLAERDSNTGTPAFDPGVSDGSDHAGSMTGSQTTLRQHLHDVANRARQMGSRIGLPPEVVDDLYLAGKFHDIGKVDPRFQSQLVGADPVTMEMLPEPLAKSLPGVARVQSYPRGMRHEMATVALLASDPGVLNEAHDPDLVLHLIATHHGWARPLAPIIEDPDPQPLTYTFGDLSLKATSDLVPGSLALDMADRFWRLVRRYGHYGLAWLEAILRLADHRQSEVEATQT